MQLFLKITISLAVILTATALSKRFPSAAGLIGVMPITGALVMSWVYLENKGNSHLMQQFTRGALWGILPSVLFFLAALLCFRKQLSLPMTLGLSFGIWLVAATLHQLALR